MKRISKNHPPKIYIEWLKENRKIGYAYNLLSAPVHAALKAQLLKEQGYICAYTGISITDELSHIEHLKPRKLFPGFDEVSYRNMVVCFPHNGGDVSIGFGAPIKRNWWNENEFISPCQRDCESKFKFSWSGNITPTIDTDTAAKQTINKLGLDASRLNRLRGNAIKAFFGFSSNPKIRKLKNDEAKMLLNNIGQKNGLGKLTEFCFVYEQLLPKYIKTN